MCGAAHRFYRKKGYLNAGITREAMVWRTATRYIG
jgi:hypothetical protein